MAEAVVEVNASQQTSRDRYMRRTLMRAQQIDKIGGWAIKLAGVMVLLGVGTILIFLMAEALPLLLYPVKHYHGTLEKMFMPQVFEGYSTAQWIWQTDVTEGGQEKFSVPLLIFGTLKGAFWAMTFSVPLALLSALFIAEFASPRVRMVIKSSIELLAGIPTVVVGFFAFVTLSTVMNGYFEANKDYFVNGQWVVFFAQIIGFAIGASAVTAKAMVSNYNMAAKVVLAIAGVLTVFVVMNLLGRGMEFVLGTTFKPVFGVTKYTQLNAILAGFCLGFAIIPIIFSVAEDAMRAVPASYREASLALGGSKWETALRVVVPSALPGIYAAVMLGLARAVGETMIVLMASGNTPILEASPFTGMRTMSAAIAIEASEKAQHTTGYHVLFFVGALLFLITFVLNAITEHVITKLKRKYQAGT